MADLFNMKVDGLGFHITAHIIAIVALFVACFAITGYISYRDIDTSGTMTVDGASHFKTSSVTPIITATTEGVRISVEDSGKVIPCDMSVAGSALILPTATVGLNYTFVLTVASGTVANNSFISAGPALVPTQHFWGRVAIMSTSSADQNGVHSVGLATTTQNRFCLASDSTLTGGAAGDRVRVKCLVAGSWCVEANLSTSGALNVSPTPMFNAAEISA